MQLWAAERGTLWALNTADGLPPRCQARVANRFKQLGSADIADLAAAMNGAGPQLIEERLRSGRRCFGLLVEGQIASYGWVTKGIEEVGELERDFQLPAEEAYIWDCRTVPAWQRQRLYSALLSQLIALLHQERVPRIWIGSSRQNQPSIRAFENAGFKPVLDLTYYRLYRLTWMWITLDPSAPTPLVSAAHRILISPRERRLGSFVIGFRS
jgi:ribosomal protein S18 acetylase RimI-like enzyme